MNAIERHRANLHLLAMAAEASPKPHRVPLTVWAVLLAVYVIVVARAGFVLFGQ